MKVAIFSDVHGNLTAFEAVLADIKRQGPDLTFFAGDLSLLGVRPKECLDLLEDESIPAVYGNTDFWLNNRPQYDGEKTAEEQQQIQTFYDLLDWTEALIGNIGLARLSQFPFHHRVSPSTNPHDDLLIVHANPRDVLAPIFPNEALQQTIYNKIKQPDDDPDLRHLLSDLETGVLAFGHIHIPNIRQWNGRNNAITLANISSVSLPLDGDPRAKYGLLTWETGTGWTISHHHVEYAIEQERQLFSQLKPPDWESLSQRLS